MATTNGTPAPPATIPPLPAAPPSSATLYYVAGIIFAGLTGGAVVLAVIITGHNDPATLGLVAQVLGFTLLIITALLGFLQVNGKQDGLHIALNGRLSQFVELAQKSAFAQGQLAGPPPPAPPVEPLQAGSEPPPSARPPVPGA